MKISGNIIGRMRRRTILSVISMAAQLGCSDVGFKLTPEGLENALMNDPNLKTQDFVFDQARPKAKVDVLFVIDNSGSMYEEQQKLAQKLSSFVSSLTQVDWQIGITTSDVSDGPFGVKGSLVRMSGTSSSLLTPQTPNYLGAFAQTITDNGTPPGCVPGATTAVCPSGDEQPLKAITLAIQKRSGANSGFFRSGADLATIILTDEDEMSDGIPTALGGVTAHPTQPSAIISQVRSEFGAAKKYSSYAIIVEPGDHACFLSQGFPRADGPYGAFASELSRLSGGLTGSLCAPDYGPSLTSIGQKVLRTATALRLRETVKPESVRVRIIPYDPNLTWEFSDNAVHLNDQPQQGTTVRVYYLPQASSAGTP